MRAALLAALALALAACGTAPKAPSKKGGYYADDGPPEKVPADIAAIPDAVPRDEPYHRAANRPYTVFGRTYTPVVNEAPMKERGIATWYGRKYHGQKTSIGETYDMLGMTAAHRTLPLPSYARVTHVQSGRSVVVRVNDRGPFHEDRVIDLSYAAAMKLGIANAGSAVVEVERVFARDAGRLSGQAAPAPAPAAQPPAAATVVTPLRSIEPAATIPLAATDATPAVPLAREPAGVYLQLGAFSSVDNAEGFRARLARELPWLLEPVQVAQSGSLHRVRLGPYKTREEAQAVADRIRASLDLAPVISPATR
jgi:rare lipoprotein A